ncbi:aromatic amino acid transport family protein [Vibrio fluvialis]|uniref:aromatic amino acid transport family protein n=1 Tax=Vibrio fluvialis TaxID=676 RepID=UPI0022AB616C|nr:aromatic amino acid transport family protein [Vibrio fluvialis]
MLVLLALPLASAGIGFSTSLMIMLALVGTHGVYRAADVENSPNMQTKTQRFTRLLNRSLAIKANGLATFAMLFLFYALCAAYIAGGGAQFTNRISEFTGLEVSGPTGTLNFHP